jgi:hypothetical protein
MTINLDRDDIIFIVECINFFSEKKKLKTDLALKLAEKISLFETEEVVYLTDKNQE